MLTNTVHELRATHRSTHIVYTLRRVVRVRDRPVFYSVAYTTTRR